MRTINIIKNLNSKIQNTKIQSKIKKFGVRIFIFIFGFWVCNFLTGCLPKSGLDLAKEYAHRSELLYEEAIGKYKDLISQGEGNDEVYLNLGKLYLDHGDYDLGIEQLSKSNELGARKLLAVSYYKIGQYTDALAIFDREGILGDDAYLYYYGLTCEKLNLYEKASDIYASIKEDPYRELAREHINIISQLNQERGLKGLDPGLKSIIQRTADKDHYPQASAVILLTDEEIEITEQNTSIYNAHFIIKILDERGRENFSEVVIGYDSTYEKPQLEYARTIKPDGEIVNVGKKHIRDVSRYLNFPLYSNARALIISMPEITEGAIIEYKLKVYKNRLISEKDFVLSYWLQESEPIVQANFKVAIPKERILHIKTLNEAYNNFNADLKPAISETDGRLKYEWEFKDIPQIIPEPNMPTTVEIDPVIIISTFDSWDVVYNWWWNLAKDKIQTDRQIKKKVKELIKDKDSDEEKAKAIYNFCAQKIRYVAVEYGQAGYEPHKAQDIFLNKYGDCKDQAILLVSMLKEAGLKAHPVLIGTKDHFNLYEDFPSIMFNHCIATVEVDGKNVFLDPTLETCPFGDLPVDDQERKVLIFEETSYDIRTTPLYPAGHNRTEKVLKIEINNDEEIHSQRKVLSYGFYNQAQRAWLLYTQPELIRQALEEAIQGISVGSKLEGYRVDSLEDLGDNVILEYTFHGPEYWTRAGNLRILPQLTSLDSSIAAKETRNYPIDFRLLDTEEIHFEISLPPIFKIKYLPPDFHIDNRWLEFKSEYSYKNSTIYFKQRKILKKREVNRSEYAEFKKFYQDLVRQIKQRIVLEREG